MDANALGRELLQLEKAYWQALKDKDAETTTRLTDFPCLLAGSQGVTRMDEATYRTMLESATWAMEDFELGDDVEVRPVSDDVAVVAYTVKERLTVEGEPVTLEAADTSVWVRRNGSWRCASHTEAITGDPWGRDRKPVN